LEEEEPTITFYVSHGQYEQQKDLNTLAASLCRRFFHDGAARQIKDGLEMSVGLPEVSVESFRMSAFRMRGDGGSSNKPEFVPDINVEEFGLNPSGKYTDYLACTYAVRCRVRKWSGMLLLYFLSRRYQFRASQRDQVVAETGLLPVAMATHVEDRKQTIKDFCTTRYMPPPFIDQTLAVMTYLLTADAEGCRCWNNRVAPALSRFAGNQAAMCFASACNNPVDKAEYDLTLEACKGYCPTVYEWLHSSTNPSGNKKELDLARYKAVCGDDFAPDAVPAEWNLTALAVGLSAAAALAGVVMLLPGSKKTKVVLALVTLAVLSGAAVFAARDLVGIPECRGDEYPKEAVCASRVTGMRLPEAFCGPLPKCDCSGFDEDCQEGHRCFSGACVPDTRPSESSECEDFVYSPDKGWKCVADEKNPLCSISTETRGNKGPPGPCVECDNPPEGMVCPGSGVIKGSVGGWDTKWTCREAPHGCAPRS
jgi:hypothetical protein